MTVKSGTGPACASCKYQRRRCKPDCPLAPYFPHNQPRLFRNAHRLFGVSNILKTLARIDPARKSDAMRSLLYEADAWDRYPAYGCRAVIDTLSFQIYQTLAELQETNARLAAYRGIADGSSAMPVSASSADGIVPANNCLPLMENGGVSEYWVHPPPYTVDLSLPQDQFQCVIQQEYDEISPYFDTIDEERPYESSSDSSEKDMLQSLAMDGQDHVSDELKDAAACFTLTSATVN